MASIRELVETDVHLVSGERLPFPDGEFDRVVVVDMLEHVPDDRAFAAELARVTRPGGRLVVNTPFRRETALRRFRHALGQTDEKHGHLRPGYDAEQLRALLSPAFTLQGWHSYSRFFSELVDTGIQLGRRAAGQEVRLQGPGRDRPRPGEAPAALPGVLDRLSSRVDRFPARRAPSRLCRLHADRVRPAP